MNLEQALSILRDKFSSLVLEDEYTLTAYRESQITEYMRMSEPFISSEYRVGTLTRKAFEIVEEWMKIHQIKRIDFDI